ncbi:hypothetical protein U27_06297 [Candidatus Vecturithrix granuli]|uniref:Uncharacterized protein n=1 Tax=Vecturithrix granuli TaxID=1499967 RepID=A0A081C408_VECG1|nr:hypothetical protein U27_06297 [Candidatus Vecturithrix granuli]
MTQIPTRAPVSSFGRFLYEPYSLLGETLFFVKHFSQIFLVRIRQAALHLGMAWNSMNWLG